MKKDTIFVQIASYRDPQLIPTLREIFNMADNPENLFVGINWQRDEKESLEEFSNHKQVRYLDYHYSESQGLGWARKEIEKLYDGEEFTLQLDSHHRFLKGWDTMMIEDYKQALQFSNKPIITTYLTPFNVGEVDSCRCHLNETPCLMSQYEFSSDKLLMSRPSYIIDYRKRDTVIKARTLSGHFYFVNSDFIKEVPYDPEIYFGGYCEETTMSVRAWTSGYDFFSPYRQYIWHEYTREGRPKHWDDHGTKSSTDKTSGERDAFARKKTRQLFEIEDNGIEILPEYGLGTIRTLHEYEIFGGFDFKNQKIQPYTLKVNEPPNPTPWEDNFEKGEIIDLTVEWDIDHFKSQYSETYKLITLGILDKNSKEIYRKDFSPEKDEEIFNFKINSHTFKINSLDKDHISLLMYGLKANNEWITPYTKSL